MTDHHHQTTEMSLARLAELIARAVLDSADQAGVAFDPDHGGPHEREYLKEMILRRRDLPLTAEQAELVADQVIDHIRYLSHERQRVKDMGAGGRA
ncbi:hypothetical protein [Aquisalimonas asiatica]|uniref:Uncharacterized protein n=1 Tax=Aquisalimonas asiatica TaxID=406100 RepID=A0A1H8UCE7_9GAMM|nr:hypothetical protein [Aquisalimonas asiatica]SEP00841.1 hypothetical protein SAMN04488052_10691 [Aquisalimonas asiatica]